MMEILSYLHGEWDIDTPLSEQAISSQPPSGLHCAQGHGPFLAESGWRTQIGLGRLLFLAASVTVLGATDLAVPSPLLAQMRRPSPYGSGVPSSGYEAPGAGLQLDDSGSAVEELQIQLAEQGYYNGDISGYFGPETQEAVYRFQRDRGLAADGVVGPATSNALYQGGSPGTYDAPVSAQFNPSGEEIVELQQRLSDLGYYSEEVSGDFNYATEAALMQFQRDQGLTADGIVGPNTEAALNRPTNEIMRPATPPNATNPTVSPQSSVSPDQQDGVLRLGSTGQSVNDLQLRLKELGFYQGEVSGVYGPETEAAVIAFQQSNGLATDGVAGPQVDSALYSFAAPAAPTSTTAPAVEPSLGQPDPAPATTTAPTAEPSLGQPSPSPNNAVAPSAAPSTAPNAAPSTFPSPSPTPNVSTGTTAPNAAAPTSNPAQPQTAQELEQARLAAEQAQLEAEQARLEAEQARSVLFQNFDEGRYSVVNLQRRLQEQGFYPGEVDGMFTLETQQAIVNAQSSYGLSQADLLGTTSGAGTPSNSLEVPSTVEIPSSNSSSSMPLFPY